MKIRDKEYPIANTTEVALLPLFACLQVTAMDGLEKEAIADLLLRQLSNPSNHRQLAYSLKAAIPSLPDELVKYRTFLHADGREEVEFAFGLSSEELVGAIAAIMEARGDTSVVAPVKEVDPKELRRQELIKELSLLDSAA